MSAAEAAPAEEWVEVYRGPRRRGHIIIRVLNDATIPSRDARRLGAAAGKPQEGIIQVPKDKAAEAVAMIELLKKNFPVLFAVGPAKSD